MNSTLTSGVPPTPTGPAVRRHAGLLAVLRWELRKLRKQYRARSVLLGALVAPIGVVVIIGGQSRPPKDTLFGRYAIDNGYSLALLVLGFASQWVLPLLTAIVAGDVFASEDTHGTWKTVLTRSASRAQLFWAKTLTAVGFAVLTLVLLAGSTIASSVLIVGHAPLVGASGQVVASGAALQLVAASWATTLAPTLGFTCLAILLSVWSRNAAIGIAAPVVIGMVMTLVGALGGIELIRPFLLTTPFESWHGLLAEPRFYGPLIEGLAVSAAWCAVTLGLSFAMLRRRDITGG